jgi:hypothetical protein
VQALMSDVGRRRAMGAAALTIFQQQLSWEVARRAVGAGSILAGADRPAERARVEP